MNWTTATDIKAQLRRLWERGELLRTLLSGESLFPLRLTMKGPSSTDLSECFDAVRAWIVDLTTASQIRIEWREVNHRILGAQRVPQSIWIDSHDQALALLGKHREGARFKELVELTRSRQPTLLPWLGKRPLHAIELAENWERLLAVVDWIQQRPRPGIYLRQVDLPDVHSKFIEAHRGVLSELLDLTLPPQVIDANQSGTGQFTARYGFLDKPARIRFRILDERVALLPGSRMPDLTLDVHSFANLVLPLERVFITENETNFLAFPPVADSMVIFGGGYGWDALAQAEWLKHRAIHYWGDIDTHGFAILDQLRSRFDHVKSLLMDWQTLMAHESLWGQEDDQIVHDLPRLTVVEQALFDKLRDNRIRKGLRLEQERVGFQWVSSVLNSVFM